MKFVRIKFHLSSTVDEKINARTDIKLHAICRTEILQNISAEAEYNYAYSNRI